jgi:hypothetical protein
VQTFSELSTARYSKADKGLWKKEKTGVRIYDAGWEKRGLACVVVVGEYLFIGMRKGQHSIPLCWINRPCHLQARRLAPLGSSGQPRTPRGLQRPAALRRAGPEAQSLPGPAWGACVRRVGVPGGRQRPPAGRERFLQSRLSAKGARLRPRERSSAGASGSLLPAGSGKADAVWSSTRQTATTSHNFILESRPAAAPVRAGGGENRRIQIRLGRQGPRPPRGFQCPLQTSHCPPPAPLQACGSLSTPPSFPGPSRSLSLVRPRCSCTPRPGRS